MPINLSFDNKLLSYRILKCRYLILHFFICILHYVFKCDIVKLGLVIAVTFIQ